MEIICSICGKDVAESEPCHPMHEKTAGLVLSIAEGVLLSPREIEIFHLMLKGNDFGARELAEEFGWLDASGERLPDDELEEFERKLFERFDHYPPWATF